MSASADLQTVIEQRLPLSVTSVVGNGVLTAFTIVHNLAMVAQPPVRVTAGAAVLVEGVDYTITQINTNSLTLTSLVGAPGSGAWSVKVSCLRVTVPIVKRREKEKANTITAAAANHGLCIFVMPPLPTHALQGNPFVFFDNVEVRVRIVEQPAKNQTGADAYDLLDDVAAALQWQPFATILSHPLQLATRPAEMAEDKTLRIIDVIFEAVYGFRPPGA